MGLRSCKELLVWQKALKLVVETYRATANLPTEEKYGLKSQMQRAAVSIPANIAEGYGRSHRGDYLHHLSMAMGSLQEWDTHIEIVRSLGLLGEESIHCLQVCGDEVGRLLTRLIQSLSV
jgi:four helix bundle protein